MAAANKGDTEVTVNIVIPSMAICASKEKKDSPHHTSCKYHEDYVSVSSKECQLQQFQCRRLEQFISIEFYTYVHLKYHRCRCCHFSLSMAERFFFFYFDFSVFLKGFFLLFFFNWRRNV